MVDKKNILNAILWGFILWLIGYIAGFVLYFVVPKDYIGWIITPIATIFTIWVLIRKIKQPTIIVGLIWTIMAIVLDYFFIVKLLNTGTSYYQLDVYLYYLLTLTLPIAVRLWKLKH